MKMPRDMNAVPSLTPVSVLAGGPEPDNRAPIVKKISGPPVVWRKAVASMYDPALGGINGNPNGGACIGRAKDMPFTVAHKTLPCGTAVVIKGPKGSAPTFVADRGPFVAGRDFDLRRAVADAVGLPGVGPIEWHLGGFRLSNKQLNHFADIGGDRHAVDVMALEHGLNDPLFRDQLDLGESVFGDVDIPNPLNAADNFLSMISDVGFWVRVAKFIGGGVLLVIGLAMMGFDLFGGAKNLTKTLTKI